MKKEIKIKQEKSPAALFIPAGLFIGMGVGYALDSFSSGMFIGLGAGFLAFAIAKLMNK